MRWSQSNARNQSRRDRVDYLIAQNVRYVFDVLAHTLFAFGDAIAKRPELRFVNAQHEGGADNIALGYARATKKPALCLLSAPGGATNIVTGRHMPQNR